MQSGSVINRTDTIKDDEEAVFTKLSVKIVCTEKAQVQVDA